MPTTRRDFLLSGTAALAGMGSPACAFLAGDGGAGREPTGAPPNILFIMVDEMPFDVMGCAGHATVQTPHLDALARSGVRFDRAYCTDLLKRANNNISQAARLAGLERKYLYKVLERAGLAPSSGKSD